MSLTSYMVVGIVAVFSGFVILYIAFRIMELLARGKKASRKAQTTSSNIQEQVESQEKKQESDDTEIAVIGAVLSEVLSKPVIMSPSEQSWPRIYSFEERSVAWRKSGWKGVRKWRASSGW